MDTWFLERPHVHQLLVYEALRILLVYEALRP